MDEKINKPQFLRAVGESDNKVKKPIRPVNQNLYPTCNSLEDAVATAYLNFPSEYRNTVLATLMMYHNTLLKCLEDLPEAQDSD